MARAAAVVSARVTSWVTRYKLRACASVGDAPRVLGSLWIHGKGRVELGHRVFFDAGGAPIELYPWEGAVISIGDDCYIGGGTSIEATESIVIGTRAHLGSFSKIMDNHFHPLHGDRNERPAPRPVVLEEDVTIGPCGIVLAGSRVTRGTSIASGTVVRACASSRLESQTGAS